MLVYQKRADLFHCLHHYRPEFIPLDHQIIALSFHPLIRKCHLHILTGFQKFPLQCPDICRILLKQKFHRCNGRFDLMAPARIVFPGPYKLLPAFFLLSLTTFFLILDDFLIDFLQWCLRFRKICGFKRLFCLPFQDQQLPSFPFPSEKSCHQKSQCHNCCHQAGITGRSPGQPVKTIDQAERPFKKQQKKEKPAFLS